MIRVCSRIQHLAALGLVKPPESREARFCSRQRDRKIRQDLFIGPYGIPDRKLIDDAPEFHVGNKFQQGTADQQHNGHRHFSDNEGSTQSWAAVNGWATATFSQRLAQGAT